MSPTALIFWCQLTQSPRSKLWLTLTRKCRAHSSEVARYIGILPQGSCGRLGLLLQAGILFYFFSKEYKKEKLFLVILFIYAQALTDILWKETDKPFFWKIATSLSWKTNGITYDKSFRRDLIQQTLQINRLKTIFNIPKLFTVCHKE